MADTSLLLGWTRSLGPAAANRLWLLAQRGEHAIFSRSRRRLERTQRSLLSDLLKEESATDFGKRHGFKRIRSYSEYTMIVPVRDYEAHRDGILRMENGEKNVLTRHPVLFFEETSGSLGGAKRIPFTAGLRRGFARAVAPWMVELSRKHPAAFRGPAYWSLSPALRTPGRTSGGIRVGTSDDTAYFGSIATALLRRALAVPSEALALRDSEAFYLETLEYLLRCRDLAFISVWSPTFFLRLDTMLREWAPELARRLERNAGDSTGKQGGEGFRRAQELRAATRGAFVWTDLWPQLEVLSCWTHAQAAAWIPQVLSRLGAARLQPKGLLSTECVVSIPWDAGDPLLAARSHFLEFRLDSGRVIPAWDLTPGDMAEVIATTGGGLWRYATGDRVEVTGFCGQLPRLRFLGRGNRVCDLVGEKLSEAQAIAALESVLPNALPIGSGLGSGIRETLGTPAFLLAERRSGGTHTPYVGEPIGGAAGYRLCIEAQGQLGIPLAGLLGALDTALSANPYYRQARALGQLGGLSLSLLPSGGCARIAESWARSRGISEGQLKPPALYPPEALQDFPEVQAMLEADVDGKVSRSNPRNLGFDATR